MRIYLIRHGKTEANERRLYCGSTDLPLSEAGREELQSLAYAIAPERFATSGMKRANETLEILFGNVSFYVDSRFREVDFGIFEMKSYEMLKNDPAYLAWITGDNEKNIPPQGESGEMFRARVLTALETLREDTVLITHGGVIAAIMEALFPREGKNRYQWQPRPGRGYAVTEEGYREIP